MRLLTLQSEILRTKRSLHCNISADRPASLMLNQRRPTPSATQTVGSTIQREVDDHVRRKPQRRRAACRTLPLNIPIEAKICSASDGSLPTGCYGSAARCKKDQTRRFAGTRCHLGVCREEADEWTRQVPSTSRHIGPKSDKLLARGSACHRPLAPLGRNTRLPPPGYCYGEANSTSATRLALYLLFLQLKPSRLRLRFN